MKFSIHDLKEKSSIDLTFNYYDKIGAVADILAIKPAHVKGLVNSISGEIDLDLHIDVELELACSKTLKPVSYQLSFDTNILFGNSIDADFPLSDTIDLYDIIFGYIVSEKPYTIYHPDAAHTSFEKERSPHPAFADLDKNLEK